MLNEVAGSYRRGEVAGGCGERKCRKSKLSGFWGTNVARETLNDNIREHEGKSRQRRRSKE